MPPGLDLAADLSATWIGFYGTADPLTPPEVLRKLVATVETGEGIGTVRVFDDLPHGFALDTQDSRFAANVAEQVWRDTLAVSALPHTAVDPDRQLSAGLLSDSRTLAAGHAQI